MKLNVKKHIIFNIPYLLFAYAGNKVCEAFRTVNSTELTDKLTQGFKNINAIIEKPIPSFNSVDLLVGLGTAFALFLILQSKRKNAKKFRKGTEYGSARWGTPEDIKPFASDVPSNNIILTQTERLTMDSRPKLPKNARNKNILVIGGSGSGKTRFFVKPNLMQRHSSYVVTDPKGTVLVECGKMLARRMPKLDSKGKPVIGKDGKTETESYVIKSLNLINFAKSMHYNPFAYIRDEKDILKLVNTIISNTKGDGDKSGEDFWVKAERLLYTAYIGYIFFEAPKCEQNFSTLIAMIDASETREEDESYQNPIDMLFEALEAKNPNHFALKQYKKYKLAAGNIK